MRTIVAGLHPRILAIGTPAFSIRETAVSRRSWKRQTRGWIGLSKSLSGEFSLRILPARSLAASHASLMFPIGLEGSTS